MESFCSFLMSLRREVIWLWTASCLWTRSHCKIRNRFENRAENNPPNDLWESYCDGDVCRSLAGLPPLPFTLQGHGDLLWSVLEQQGKALQKLVLQCHLLGFPCNCNSNTKINFISSK